MKVRQPALQADSKTLLMFELYGWDVDKLKARARVKT